MDGGGRAPRRREAEEEWVRTTAPEPPVAEPALTPPSPSDSVLDLQRTLGNRATSQVLTDQPMVEQHPWLVGRVLKMHLVYRRRLIQTMTMPPRAG